ncbi:MFS transporter [Frateuria aurantia]
MQPLSLDERRGPPLSGQDQRLRHGTRAFGRTSRALFAAGFATFGLLYCVQPLMPEFSRDFHVDAGGSALSLSLSTAVLAVAMLFAGGVSDAVGRKPVMAVSLLSSAALVLLSSMAPGWHSLLLIRTLLGLALSGLPAVAMTYLAEEVHPESIGLGMGLYISGNAIGGMCGRLIAGLVADAFGWRIGLATVGAIGLVSAVLFCRMLPASRHHQRQPLDIRPLLSRLGSLLHDRALLGMLAQGFILLGVFVSIYSVIGYRLLASPFNLNQTETGLIFSVYLVGSFSSAWMGNLAGRMGRGRVLMMALGMILGGAWLTLSAHLLAVALGIVAITFGFFGGHSTVSAWVGQRGGKAKAQAASLYLFCYYLGSSVLGVAGGWCYARAGWSGVIIAVTLLLIIALAIAAALKRSEQPLNASA